MPSAETGTTGVDRGRVAARLDALWEIALGPGGGADRPAWSAAEATALTLVAGWAREAGLEPALDPYGNLWAAPTDHDGPLLCSGSHVDTVPDGGRYDGALGTVLALEAAHALAGGTPDGARPALLVCAAEEAPRFGAGTLGSRLAVGTLDDGALDELHDRDGVSARSALADLHAALADLPRIDALPLERVRAHVEVHIEQRGDLRAEGGPALGVVERVAVPHRHRIVVDGAAGHAGEVGMDDRRDALAAAAEITLALEQAARRRDHRPTVATVGRLVVEPGAVSTIPGRAVLDLEVRSTDPLQLRAVEVELDAAVQRICAQRRVSVERTLLRGGEPVVLDSKLARIALAATRSRGARAQRTYSGAGHDAQHLAGRIPTALLFVPLAAGGESHTPDECASDDEVVLAGEVLCDVLGGAPAR